MGGTSRWTPYRRVKGWRAKEQQVRAATRLTVATADVFGSLVLELMSMSDLTEEGADPFALPVIRGRARTLEPRVHPDSNRDMLRWRKRLLRTGRPLCVSLWSGAGGLDLGLEQAGYHVAVAADHDEWACQTHGFNSQALVVCRDLGDPDATRTWLEQLELPPVALVAGGFPCQPYSRAGQSRIRQLVADDLRPAVDSRASAWQSFVAAVEALRPTRALAENVPDLARFNNGAQLRDIVRALEAIDYEVDVRILPARAFGVAQFRERLFIQAVVRGGEIYWPQPTDELDPSVRNAIGDLPEIDAGAQQDPIEYDPSSTEAPSWARDGIPAETDHYLFDHICRDVRQDDLRAFEQLPPGGTYLDVPAELRRYDDENFTDKYKRLEWDRPSRTITAHIARDGYWYIHPEQHRTLSIREAARIQTFPDWFRFAGFPSNRFVQIGNAVPPLLGRAVGEAMLLAAGRAVKKSTAPAAARVLRETADETWEPLNPWELVVRELVFNGRAGDERVENFLEALPDAASAAKLKVAATEHERRAQELALALGVRVLDVPDDPEDLRALTGASESAAQLLVSLLHANAPPRAGATIRLAERVTGVRRAGSLNGLSHVAVARVSDFGNSPAANQLLLDIARFVCLPEEPRCFCCPLAGACDYALSRSGLAPATLA